MKLSIQGKMCVDSARIKGDVKSVMYKQTLCLHFELSLQLDRRSVYDNQTCSSTTTRVQDR
jgi:hypothetical protein